MSEPKLISPMLDDFEMGGPISDHDGVRCCPAMRKDSDEKYIVKIISVPASQTKLDALLLTGAYPDKNAALAYFKELADGVADEKKILDNLAQLEGFISFEDCQVVPMDDATGYDVYLLSNYRMTLERQNSKQPMTQLAAVNLGLDLCAALSACRRSGYMCVDLKPSNIYVVGDKEYRIGDLGFVRLNSLKYESLPDKYRSCYTAPELEDAFAYLNETMDIYAVGLILYQVFNGGALPFSGNQAPNVAFAAPAYADEEMAEIILKACAPDPTDRWQDPVQMGQAIVGYMQKNGVNETPLTAEFFGAQDETPEATDLSNDVEADIQTDEAVTSTIVSETDDALSAVSEPESIEFINPVTENVVTEDIPVESDIQVDAVNPDEDVIDNLSFLDDLAAADKLLEDIPVEPEEDLNVAEMLDQIEELAAHQIPDPVVAPDPIEIKLPEPITVEETVGTAVSEIITDNEDIAEANETSEELAIEELLAEPTVVEEEIPEEEKPYVPKKKRTGLVLGIILAIVLALAVGAYCFYTMYYLQPVHSLELNGSEDRLQVQLSADIDESMLLVVCADPHGNKIAAPVAGGTAVFSGLAPDTAYTVTVEVDGFHKLTGTTSKVYSTPVQTKILQISAVTGSEDGSVILSFAVEGPDSNQWNVIYNAEGEAERVTAFPSHMVTLAGLTVGKEYTFRLEPVDDIYISGETELNYMVNNVVCAENLHIASFMDGELVAKWDAPNGAVVSNWFVRCYNSDIGFDETVTTGETTATFQNIDESVGYTVEVTAENMSVNQRVQVAAYSVTVSDFAVDASATDVLSLSWNANREIPAEGWTLRYSVNDVSATQTIATDANAAQVAVVPNGNYVFNILDVSGNAVLGGPFTYNGVDAAPFDAYGVTQSDVTARLCKTPASSSWSYSDLKDEDYVNTFASGEKISMVLALSKRPESSDTSVKITYVIYNEDSKLESFAHDSQIWQTMWYQNYCELDVPGVPTDVGTYNLIVYFNGMEVGSQKFEITA